MDNPDPGIQETDRIMPGCFNSPNRDTVGVYSGRTPLQDRERIFPGDIDRSCPWQFGNSRVVWLSIICAMSD
jgi:homospermidine synthase